MKTNRRDFIRQSAMGAAGLGLAAALPDYLYAEARKDLFLRSRYHNFHLSASFGHRNWRRLILPPKHENWV